MSKEYDEYLSEHIANVGKAVNWMQDNGIVHIYEPLEQEKSIFELHDASKYGSEEYDAYDSYFYGSKTRAVKEAFNRAWLHHIHNNPHHWQYWVLLEDDPDTGNDYICVEMPPRYVIEMIADWWSFSFKCGNLREIFSWYDEHKDIIKLHSNTRKQVEGILDKIKSKLDEMEENYDNA